MLLINPVNKNETVETFNARKTFKAYIDFGIFSLYFIVVICKNFRFASLLSFADTITNYKLLLQLTLIKRHTCTFCQ